MKSEAETLAQFHAWVAGSITLGREQITNALKAPGLTADTLGSAQVNITETAKRIIQRLHRFITDQPDDPKIESLKKEAPKPSPAPSPNGTIQQPGARR